MLNIIYLGYAVPSNEVDRYSGISIAGNKMQLNILKNISSDLNISFSCLSITPLASFPRDKNLFQRNELCMLAPRLNTRIIPYINVLIIKQLWQMVEVYNFAKHELERNPESILLCFNLFPQIGIPMRLLKRKFPQLKTVAILADLPIDDQRRRNVFSRWLRHMFDKSTLESIDKCDKFVILNNFVAHEYLKSGQQYCIVEGGIDSELIKDNFSQSYFRRKERNILFSGALTEYNGILNLIKAMSYLVDYDIYLDIYGKGPLELEVKQAAVSNFRIRFFGFQDNDIVTCKQKEAWLLVNPRQIEDPISKVTFPSKIFEYMLSLTPILTTRLNSLGSDYIGKVFFTDDDTPESIAKSIIEINDLSFDILEDATKKAYEFVATKKSWNVQVRKIIDLIMS